jgi:predicted ArsR family transcriptional regulator
MDEIVSALEKEPLTYKEISEKTGIPAEEVTQKIGRLRRKGTVRTVIIALGSSGRKRSFYSKDIVGELTGKAIAYFPWQEKGLGEKITDYIPDDLTLGMRKSLTHKLKNILPEKSFEVVYEYMHKQTIK